MIILLGPYGSWMLMVLMVHMASDVNQCLFFWTVVLSPNNYPWFLGVVEYEERIGLIPSSNPTWEIPNKREESTFNHKFRNLPSHIQVADQSWGTFEGPSKSQKITEPGIIYNNSRWCNEPQSWTPYILLLSGQTNNQLTLRWAVFLRMIYHPQENNTHPTESGVGGLVPLQQKMRCFSAVNVREGHFSNGPIILQRPWWCHLVAAL